MNAPSLPFRHKGDREALAYGDKARDKRDWPTAVIHYRRYLQTQPNHFAVWVQLGHALKESAQHAEAEAAYYRALALDELNPDLLLSLGHLYKLIALRELESLGGSPPTLARPRNSNIAAVRRLLAMATARFTALTSANRKRIRRLADDARDLRHWAEAADLYQRYLKLRPDDFAIWVQLGHALKESGRRGEAMVAYRRALALDAQDADLLLNIGHLYNLVGDWGRSKDFYSRSAAVTIGVPSPDEFWRPAPSLGTTEDRVAGDAARDRLDWLEAAERYRRYLTLRPRHFAIWVQLGHALKESGQLFEAEVAYCEAMFLNPRDADLLLNLGHLHKVKGDRDASVDFYRRSLAQDGNEHARAELRSLGLDMTIAQAPPPPTRRNIVRRLVATRSWFAGKPRRTLARANQARDRLNWSVAAEQYRLYLKIRPDDFAIWVQLGHALKESGQLHQALGAYGQAFGLNPHDADLLLNLGRIHGLMGHFETAADLFRRSILQDGNTHAMTELNRLPLHK
jgi:Flp pilus assembly protein TadD